MRTRLTRVLAMLGCGLACWPSQAIEARPEISDELFTNQAVRHLRIEIPASGMNTLRQYEWRAPGHPEDRVPVPATIREGRTVYTNVAVHLKGAAGSFRPIDDKPGFTLKFDKLAPGQRFHGLAKISLNNSVQDPSYLSERLCRELFAEVGVPVPRADYATVELNGRMLGLYVLTEGWDKRFLKRHFADVSGNLYDPPQGYDLNKTLWVSSGANPDDQSELKAVVRACAHSNLNERLPAIRQVLDVDRFLSLCVLDVMMWNWDGYALNKNNYRAFHDMSSGKVVILPHGLDQMFWIPNAPLMTGRNGAAVRGLLQTAEGRQLYLDRFRQFYGTVFELTRLTNRVEQLTTRVRPALARCGTTSDAEYVRAVTLLRQRMVLRYRSLEEQLAGVNSVLKLKVGEETRLSGWQPRLSSGVVMMEEDRNPRALHLRAQRLGSAAWQTTVWLEEGTYLLTARVKTRGVQSPPATPVPKPVIGPDGKAVTSSVFLTSGFPYAGAGLRVWSNRKVTDGTHWGWFPYHMSRDYLHRGEIASTNCPNTRLLGTQDWQEITYELELRQPLADLEVRCELNAESGEAWFDPEAIKLRRLTEVCP